MTADPAKTTAVDRKDVCMFEGYHYFEEFIDPRSGGFVSCKRCGLEIDCEEDEEW